MLAAVIGLLHRNHQRRLADAEGTAAQPPLERVQETWPTATKLVAEGDAVAVQNAVGELLGRVVQTSPQADRIIGFSGPTNVLIAFDPAERIRRVGILSSRDTEEHARRVTEDGRFLASYVGMSRTEAAGRTQVDGVAGATLTSLAIAESIVQRLGGQERSLRFPDPVTVADVRPLFPEAMEVAVDPDLPSLWRVTNAANQVLGQVLRGSPAIDNVVGYQGPTDVLIGLGVSHGATADRAYSPDELDVIGVLVVHSYDNEPYVGYVRDDRYFLRLFQGRSLAALAAMDVRAERVEGVSGATMTSLAVAQGLVAAARRHTADTALLESRRETARFRWTPRDLGTVLVTACGVILGLSSWRGRTWTRIPFLILLVVYLGFINGDLVSQALLVGWSQNGVPWRTMLGPMVLSFAAVLLPLVTGRNVYCSHLCPHGAAQQLLLARLPWRAHLGPRLHRALSLVPGLLLVWVTFVAITGAAFSLVDIEPFDAYVPAIAGWPALTIFVAGLAASLFVPMAYCQYGCPTGALLGWLRRHSRSDDFGPGDLLAMACLAVALLQG